MKRFQEKRSGVSIVECIVALLILTVAVMSATQLTFAVMTQQRRMQRRQIANIEAANLMEYAFTLPEEQLTAQTLADRAISDVAKQHLNEIQIQADVTETEDGPPGKRIHLLVRWSDVAGKPARPFSLTAWRYSQEPQP